MAIRNIFIISLLVCSQFAMGQSKAELKEQRDAILKEIRFTNSLISESRKAQQMTESEINVLQKQVDLHAQLSRSIRREMSALEEDIERNDRIIARKEKELEELKEEYSQLVYLAYKHNNSDDQMLYIFAADDFYQAWMRLRHLKDIARYREDQATEIVTTKALLAAKGEELIDQRKEKVSLLAEQKEAQAELDKSRKVKREALSLLQQDEKSLKQQLRDKEKEQAALNKAIERLIAAEIAKNKKSNDGSYSLTPEEELSSKSFASNKAKLPWPVAKGVITGRFGKQPHPVLPGIEITNNGIDISTEKSAMVRAIFQGEVSGIIEIPGSGMAVVIKHGGYRSVYSNLQEVLVSKGQSIDTKQSLGVLLPDGSNSKSHLEIWQVTSGGMKKLDPNTWIAK